jgi:uncharacterized alkaline shock family protein YloU
VSTSPQDPEAELVGRIAGAVADCPDVVSLSGGLVGEVASYLPGRRVAGVRLREDTVDVHVVARYGPTIAAIADQVRSVVAPLVSGRRVDVGVDGLATDEEIAAKQRPADGPAPAEPEPNAAPRP